VAQAAGQHPQRARIQCLESCRGDERVTLVLSFYGDGPKWENFVYLPAYPSGCSYFRPFRYRDKWVEPALLARLRRDWKSVADQELVVAARFLTAPWTWSVLPIRKARLTHFRFNEGEEHYIHFQLREMIDFRERPELQTLMQDIPEDEQTRVGQAFMFESSLSFPEEAFVPLDAERAAWAGLADALTKSALPIPAEVRNAVFIRVQWPVRKDERLDSEVIAMSGGEGPLHGFKLAEGAIYEFEFAHRYPSNIGTNNRMPPFRLDLAASDGLSTNPKDEEISGNYETHFFTASSPTSSKLPTQLVLDPEDDSLPGSNGQSPIPRLKVPVRVGLGIGYRFRTRWVWLVVMLAGLLLSNLIAFSSDQDIARDDVFRFTIGAAIAALAIFASQQRSTK
jgi:hypothetical protein